MTVASMAMYPFPHLRSAYDSLWDGVRSRLSSEAPELNWSLEASDACRRGDLLVAQTCGWPLVTELATTVNVLGTFDHDVDGSVGGTYCAVLVSHTDESLVDILHRPGLIVAANSPDSLSGWISLQSVAGDNGVLLDKVEWTDSHAASIEVVRERRADLAAIDAVSWAHLAPSGLAVVGHGPRVSCLPLVTARSSSPVLIGELRRAFAATVADPAMETVCSSLRIRGYVDRQLADYEAIRRLVELS